ncbi:MAG: hypothetical protein FJ271_18850 [Planctomycetes bacterium]|nr:hypothetical protein [Planctomycetota bacterium]
MRQKLLDCHGKPIDLAKVERDDKRRSAVHEAGHVTVGVVKGFGASVSIFRTNTPDIFAAKTWTGQCQLLKPPRRYSIRYPKAFAVAGMVAEQLDDVPDINVIDIMINWEDNGATEIGLSNTDLENAPKTWPARERAVEAALTILRQNEAFFSKVVAELIEQECPEDYWRNALAPAAKPTRKTRNKKLIRKRP